MNFGIIIFALAFFDTNVFANPFDSNNCIVNHGVISSVPTFPEEHIFDLDNADLKKVKYCFEKFEESAYFRPVLGQLKANLKNKNERIKLSCNEKVSEQDKLKNEGAVWQPDKKQVVIKCDNVIIGSPTTEGCLDLAHELVHANDQFAGRLPPINKLDERAWITEINAFRMQCSMVKELAIKGYDVSPIYFFIERMYNFNYYLNWYSDRYFGFDQKSNPAAFQVKLHSMLSFLQNSTDVIDSTILNSFIKRDCLGGFVPKPVIKQKMNPFDLDVFEYNKTPQLVNEEKGPYIIEENLLELSGIKEMDMLGLSSSERSNSTEGDLLGDPLLVKGPKDLISDELSASTSPSTESWPSFDDSDRPVMITKVDSDQSIKYSEGPKRKMRARILNRVLTSIMPGKNKSKKEKNISKKKKIRVEEAIKSGLID